MYKVYEKTIAESLFADFLLFFTTGDTYRFRYSEAIFF